MQNSISSLTERVLKNIVLWAKVSIARSLFILFVFIIVGVPLIQFLQNIILTIPYVWLFKTIVDFFQKNFFLKDGIFILLLSILTILFLSLKKEFLLSKIITEKFDQEDLSSWSIPLGAGWTIQDCPDYLGKMLSITRSFYPGTLKEAYGWYDYEVRFLFKFDNEAKNGNKKLGIFIRSENNLNGVMLQLSDREFRPHLLYNGTYIVDQKNFETLPTILKTNEWIPISVCVKGNIVTVKLFTFQMQYKILTKVFNMESSFLKQKKEVTLDMIEKEHDRLEELSKKWIEQADKIDAMPASEGKNQKWEELLREFNKFYPNTTTLSFEYQRGSVGFRESGDEHVYLRELRVRKI